MISARGLFLTCLACAAALAIFVSVAGEYFTSRGFPLDDAWIHAVYGRSLARSGELAYNPGEAATGDTAPLWTVVIAASHLVTRTPESTVLLVKLTGLVLHLGTSLVLLLALRARPAAAAIGAALTAFHPDLVAASVSGMEVPLAALTAAALLLAATFMRRWSFAVLSFLAPFARPELAVLSIILPSTLFLLGALSRQDRASLNLRAAAGNAACYGLIAAYSLAVSGLPLPATFHAKVDLARPGLWSSEMSGLQLFAGLAGQPVFLVAALVCASTLLVFARHARDALPIAAVLAGVAFCASSFALIHPGDPAAFYHQRYILPVLPLLIAPVPSLAQAGLERIAGRACRVLFAILLVPLTALLVLAAPARFRRLSNDARNVDEVQVAVGRALARARASDVAWAVDAGAARYFGHAFVVDMIGLNTPALLRDDAQQYLDEHPPRFLESVPDWSTVEGRTQHAAVFRPSTRYTVTSFPRMQQHALIACAPGVAGRYTIRSRVFRYTCAP